MVSFPKGLTSKSVCRLFPRQQNKSYLESEVTLTPKLNPKGALLLIYCQGTL